MDWQIKILEGSSHEEHYNGGYRDDGIWNITSISSDDSTDREREEVECAIALSLSLSEEDQKGKRVVEYEFESEDEDFEVSAKFEYEETEQFEKLQSDDDEKLAKVQLEEDEQLAKAIQESLNMESPPRYDSGNIFQPLSVLHPSGYRKCAGCNTKIAHGQFLRCMGACWHPDCFCCHACNLPITDHEFSVSGNRPYHKSCYKEQHHPRCYVCSNFIPKNSAGRIEYRAHPFWQQKYCPSHEHDGTPRCCSCERMEVS